MSEWWRYDFADFLLFSADTYWRLFALHNADYWPLGAIATVGLIALYVATVKRWRWTSPAVALSLAAAWIFVAEAFLAGRYAPINWVISDIRLLFLAQAGLLFALGWRLSFATRATSGARALVFLALAYPLLAPLNGREWAQAELVGLAPDPTAIATLGLVAMARIRLLSWLFMMIPILWLAFSAATLFTMGAATGFVPLVAIVLALATVVRSHRAGR
ncbi:MAG: DUF6064 family protein [Pseudomonadota bacterium]